MADFDSTINKAARGAAAGFLATIPMTATMATIRAALPKSEQYALPPRRVVDGVEEKTGSEGTMSEDTEEAVTVVAHLAFGAAAGALYSLLFDGRRNTGTSLLTGVGYGLTVWAGSYLGWLPALKILPSATHEPKRPVIMNITAHVIWGISAAALVNRLSGKRG